MHIDVIEACELRERAAGKPWWQRLAIWWRREPRFELYITQTAMTRMLRHAYPLGKIAELAARPRPLRRMLP